jgi:hypothetical protein
MLFGLSRPSFSSYKGFSSIVLMALVDADYKFLWIDVGSDGSSNDASVYYGSELKEGLCGWLDISV